MKPQRVSVLLNAHSSKIEREGRGPLRAELETAFEKHAISASLEFLPGDDLLAGAERALRKVKRGELDAVIVCGGDGSIRTVVSALAGSDVPLGIIPLGTLNHFAKDLKIPLAIDQAVSIIAAGMARPIDIGEVNGRIFINNSSIGIYPYLVLNRERRRRNRGLPKWLAMILAGFLAFWHWPVRRLSISAEGWLDSCRSPCIFVGNNVYRLNGPSLGTRERLDEGTLCLYVAKQQSRASLLWLACRSILGFLDQPKDLRIVILPTVEIRSRRRKQLVAFDGEIETVRTPLQYRIKPGALEVFAPSTSNA